MYNFSWDTFIYLSTTYTGSSVKLKFPTPPSVAPITKVSTLSKWSAPNRFRFPAFPCFPVDTVGNRLEFEYAENVKDWNWDLRVVASKWSPIFVLLSCWNRVTGTTREARIFFPWLGSVLLLCAQWNTLFGVNRCPILWTVIDGVSVLYQVQVKPPKWAGEGWKLSIARPPPADWCLNDDTADVIFLTTPRSRLQAKPLFWAVNEISSCMLSSNTKKWLL